MHTTMNAPVADGSHRWRSRDLEALHRRRRRRRGIGPRLLDAAIGSLGKPHSRVQLEHIASNVDAGRFHDRHGFAVARTDTSDDPRTTVVWRERAL